MRENSSSVKVTWRITSNIKNKVRSIQIAIKCSDRSWERNKMTNWENA